MKKVHLAYEFERGHIDLNFLSLIVARMKAWGQANPGFEIAINGEIMSVVFLSLSRNHPDPLMVCGRRSAEAFVETTELICRYYRKNGVFAEGGEIIADQIYIDVDSLESIFQDVCLGSDLLWYGWACLAAGMLDVALKQSHRDSWGDHEFSRKPQYYGVDVPRFEI